MRELVATANRTGELAEQRQHGFAYKVVAPGGVVVATFGIKLMLTILANHADADKFAVDEIGKFTVEHQKHILKPIVSVLYSEISFFIAARRCRPAVRDVHFKVSGS